jgi:hypothetical protein
MTRAVRALVPALVFGAALTAIHVSAQSSSISSIVVQVQTFGKPRADFPVTIQIHSPVLDSENLRRRR